MEDREREREKERQANVRGKERKRDRTSASRRSVLSSGSPSVCATSRVVSRGRDEREASLSRARTLLSNVKKLSRCTTTTITITQSRLFLLIPLLYCPPS